MFLFIQHKHEFSCFSCSFVATYVILLFMFVNSCLYFYVVHAIFLLFVFCSSYSFRGTLPFGTFNLYMCGVIQDSKLGILCSQLVLVLCLIYAYIYLFALFEYLSVCLTLLICLSLFACLVVNAWCLCLYCIFMYVYLCLFVTFF